MRLTITNENRDAWLAMRRETVGASEAPAALGVSKYDTPLSLYLRKVGATPDSIEETDAMRFGTLLEPIVLDEYQRRTGRTIVERQAYYRGDTGRHFMSATLDGLTEDGIAVEAKTVGAFAAKDLGIEGSDEIPAPWLVQAHQQMILSGARRVDFAVLVGGQTFKSYQVDFHEGLAEAVEKRVANFWTHVLNRVPPRVTPGRDAEALSLLYRDLGPTIEADETLADLVATWEGLAQEARDLDRETKQHREAILEKLGQNSAAILPDGRVLKRSVSEVAAATIQRKAYSSVRLSVVKG